MIKKILGILVLGLFLPNYSFAHHPGNWKSIHSEEFENKYGSKKNKSYYWLVSKVSEFYR